MTYFSIKNSTPSPGPSVILFWYPDSKPVRMIPIGILSRNGAFEFRYVAGVQRAFELGFVTSPEFPHTDRVYHSDQLFAIFRNRLMNRRRLGEYLEAMELSGNPDPLVEMARTGGKRATDRFRVVSIPEPVEGQISLIFFAVGVSQPPISQHWEERIKPLQADQVLSLVRDPENEYDSNAIKMESEKGLVGWVPAYYARALAELLDGDATSLECRVRRVNYPPTMYTPDILLVSITGFWPKDWQPFSEPEFQPIVREQEVGA